MTEILSNPLFYMACAGLAILVVLYWELSRFVSRTCSSL